jgi:acyl carrier protein
MVLDAARAWSAKPGRKLVAAYLRVLGGRGGSSESVRFLRDRIEPRLRALVADVLGVDVAALESETSLAHDLAADSLDLLDVVVQVEDEFGVAFPEREIGAIATYGDLAAATVALVACRMRAEGTEPEGARVELRMGEGPVPRVVRVLGSEPYDRELLRDALRSARPDETVDVTRPGGAPAGSLERTLVRARFAGTDVRTPGDAVETSPEPPAADAADLVRSWPATRLVTASLSLMDVLAHERDASVRRLSAPRAVADELAGCRGTTDDRVAGFRTVVETYLDVLDDSRAILHAAARELGRLDLVRRAVDERAVNVDEASNAFDSIADALLCYVHALQSQAAWLRTRLPPRAMSARPDRTTEQHELRA